MSTNSISPTSTACRSSVSQQLRVKNSMIDTIEACFAFPALFNLSGALAAVRGSRRGPRPQYPDICMLAVLAAARAVGGVQPVVRELSAKDSRAWRACAALLATADSEIRLPNTPPTRDQVVTFQERIADTGAIEVLEQAFIDASVKMAIWMGHFDPAATPDWLRPDPQHALYGDGTVIAPFSNASTWTHPVTGEVVLVGSRARDARSARIQSVRTDTSVDDKADRRGINFVSMHTWTAAGRVVLATGYALGGETPTAVQLMRAVQERAQGGVHTVTYDGVVTGWVVDWLMGSLRIQAVNKIAVASKKDPHAPTKDLPVRRRPALVPTPARTERRLAAAGLVASPELVSYEHNAQLDELYRSGEPLPVGLCLYPRAKAGTYDVVYSRHHEVEPAVHTIDGEACTHRLVVDDGALYVVQDDLEREHLMKASMPSCLAATAIRDAQRNTWTRRTTWLIPCEYGDFEQSLTWRPVGAFRPPTSERTRVDPLAELRPTARAHDGFSDVYGRRNDSESYNQWFQSTLRHHGVAMSLTLNGQRLDFLMGAVLNNAITYSRELRRRAEDGL